MTAKNIILASFAFSLLLGCSGKGAPTAKTPVANTQHAIEETLKNARQGVQSGPLSLTHRKLPLAEIAEHLDMDEETANLHLKTTNIHGYYGLMAKNYPPGIEFVLYHAGIAGKINATKSFFVNEKGTLITPMDDTCIPLENNFLFFSNYLPGEPAEFILTSKDAKYSAATRIIPNPIAVTDKEQRRVSVEIASPDKRTYIVHCSGFKPFGQYMLITRFENEKYLHQLEADSNGELFQSTRPTLPWVINGDGSIELRGEDIDLPITLEFQWGA